jgi:2'-5' RNA ligase
MISAFPVRLDQRPFRAHITLARKAQQRPDFDFEPIRLKAYDFALVQSVSTENGVRYHVLASWPLSG